MSTGRTNLTFFYDRPPSSPVPLVVDITAKSRNSESLKRIRPERQGWWGDRVDWVQHLPRQGDGGVHDQTSYGSGECRCRR